MALIDKQETGMETRVNENEFWMATLLKSIGDAVITTDGLGMIRAMNGAAEVLTGWTCKEARAADY
jgi:PAS domain-containing protein